MEQINPSFRQPGETMQQYRGRQKRELNAANEALHLEEGEPIMFGGRRTRYRVGMINRVHPVKMRRLEGKELDEFLAEDIQNQLHLEQMKRDQQKRDEFYGRRDVQDACAVRTEIEMRLEEIIHQLDPEEWAELRKRLEER